MPIRAKGMPYGMGLWERHPFPKGMPLARGKACLAFPRACLVGDCPYFTGETAYLVGDCP